MPRYFVIALVLLATAAPSSAVQCTFSSQVATTGLPNPILFVTQMPVPADFTTIGSTFGNHLSDAYSSGRGGDLYILYPDGELCNLTREGGFGEIAVHQGSDSISVRDPHVHWDGSKALFSMVIGAANNCFQQVENYWQLYEIDELSRGKSMTITKVANQPLDFNNIYPIYSPDGRVVFASDRPRDGRRHLYPQHDEYESAPSNSGLWALDPASGALEILDHSPSGDFDPLIDSYGRLMFTRWDHLQTDQQAVSSDYDNFDWATEEPDAPTLPAVDIFPEARFSDDPNINDHRFNHFFPWMMNTDGSELETLNHIGRHELHDFFGRDRLDDPNLTDFFAAISGRVNDKSIESFMQIVEDPTTPGLYYGVDAPEFNTHASGQIVAMSAPPHLPADQIVVQRITHDETRDPISDGQIPGPNQTGHYRDPAVLSNGTLLSAHTSEMRSSGNEGGDFSGNCTQPDHVPEVWLPRYDFRIKKLTANVDHFVAGTALTGGPGLSRQLQFFHPDRTVTYDGPLWELSPVEVRVRPQPPITSTPVPAVEAQVFADENVDLAAFQQYLRDHDLALVISRDVTTRDAADQQQAYNLQVPGGTQTTGTGGTIYDAKYQQFFQADQVRAKRFVGATNPVPGRRPLARTMHDGLLPPSTGPDGSVNVSADGSTAAMVPAHRAVSWQLTDSAGTPTVRERYWLTFQPGEVRVCASCHGLNSEDQAGAPKPVNPPEALRDLLRFWKNLDSLFVDGFETGGFEAWTTTVGN